MSNEARSHRCNRQCVSSYIESVQPPPPVKPRGSWRPTNLGKNENGWRRMDANPHKWMSQIIHCISQLACYSPWHSLVHCPSLVALSASLFVYIISAVFNLQKANQSPSFCDACGGQRFGGGKISWGSLFIITCFGDPWRSNVPLSPHNSLLPPKTRQSVRPQSEH